VNLALPCIICKRALRNATDDPEGNQPYGGTAFITHGHYGSTAYDPMDGHYLELNICDPCLIDLAQDGELVMQGRDRQPALGPEGLPVWGDWEDAHDPLTPWQPTQEEIDHVLGRGKP
jgi:hypothetical protein